MNRSDGPVGGRLPELLAVVAVAVPGLLLTAVVALLVAILAAALPGSTGLAGTAFALVVGVGLVGTLLAATISWLAVRRTRRAVRPRVDDVRVRWFRRARRLESVVPPARSLGLSGRVEPDEGTIVAATKRRYVAGDVDERGFERELELLLDDEPLDHVDDDLLDRDADAWIEREFDGAHGSSRERSRDRTETQRDST